VALGFTRRTGTLLPYCKVGVQLGCPLTVRQDSRGKQTGEVVMRSSDHGMVVPFQMEGLLAVGVAVP
jgi:hypothetical protein